MPKPRRYRVFARGRMSSTGSDSGREEAHLLLPGPEAQRRMVGAEDRICFRWSVPRAHQSLRDSKKLAGASWKRCVCGGGVGSLLKSCLVFSWGWGRGVMSEAGCGAVVPLRFPERRVGQGAVEWLARSYLTPSSPLLVVFWEGVTSAGREDSVLAKTSPLFSSFFKDRQFILPSNRFGW